MTNDRELVKWAGTPAGNTVLNTTNWVENSSSFIDLLSQYLLSIYHASASISNERDRKISALMTFSILERFNDL